MAQVSFPSSPTDGQQYTVNNVTYTWNNTAGLWEANNATALADTFVEVAGDTMTGDLVVPGFTAGTGVTVSSTGQAASAQQTVTASAWDLSTGNNWTIAAIAIPQPTSGVAGQSGTITVTAAPTSWPAGGALKYPGGSVPALSTFPAVIPYYVQSSSEVLIGNATEGIS